MNAVLALRSRTGLTAIALTLTMILSVASQAASELRRARKLFTDPPREFSSAPLWVWNDLVTEEQLRDSLRTLRGQNIRQVFVHPRPGLITPYLGEEWFRLWKFTLQEARRLGMYVWIYDENSYPSGFAGGWVPELMPDSRGMGVEIKESSTPPKWSDDLLAVFHAEDGSAFADVSEQARRNEPMPASGTYLVAAVRRADPSPWHGGRWYVNLLTKGVTEKFLDVTLGAYDREIGDEYGRQVPGVFTDEPNIRPAGGFPWCPDLPQVFKARWGYNLESELPSLIRETGDWRRVRHNYFQTLNELFIERWAKTYYTACEKRGLEFTGHYWDHEWPSCLGVPDNMSMAAWQHRPGIDILMNHYAEDTHAQFGNIRICREISSISHQLGRSRNLVEIYGASGWDLRFADMKRIADWLLALGVNTMNEHLSYLTIRGARKRDHPQSFSYHEPWWKAYHLHEDYLTRLSAILSQGQQVNRILVLEPTSTAWMFQGKQPALDDLSHSFMDLLGRLEAAQVEYDLGCESVIASDGGIGGGPRIGGAWSSAATLRVGQRSYQVIVLPPHTRNLNQRTVELLHNFLIAGGTILSCGPPPERLDGAIDPQRGSWANSQRGWKELTSNEVVAVLKELMQSEDVVLSRAADDRGLLFHHRRELEDGQVLFLVNTSADHPSRGTIRAKFPGIERWDPYDGTAASYPHRVTATGVEAAYELPPSGSLLLTLTHEHDAKPPHIEEVHETTLHHQGEIDMRRIGPNVLTLDYVTVSVGSETLRDRYFYPANQFVWQKHGFDRNPWDSAVQFQNELLQRSFPPASGFEAEYRFVIDEVVPKNIAVVVERPDLYTITCNGMPVHSSRHEWWMDKSFGKLTLSGLALSGTNVIRLKATPFTIQHELEPIYILGDFSLQAADHGWRIQPEISLTEQNGRGILPPWNELGHPFYAEGVSYSERFSIQDTRGSFSLSVSNWHGSVAQVVVNGREAGWIVAPPWELDVSSRIRRGENRVELIVLGTLKNTLGPHHGRPSLGSAWPDIFQKAPTSGPPPGGQYSTIGYGLFEPFVLKHQTKQKPRSRFE